MKVRIQNDKWLEIIENKTGTEKQINWANKIKLEKFALLFGFFANYELDITNLVKKYEDRIDKLNNIIDAKFWIDNRSKLSTELLKEIK